MNLQKLAEKINERWRESDAFISSAKFGDEPAHPISLDIMMNGAYPISYDINSDDYINATWIIWCLDRLEELGMSPNLSCQRRDGRFDCMWLVSGPMEGTTTSTGEPIMDHKTMASPGKTRAEAVTLALAKALGVEDE
jgi:hypothetical protein